MSVCVLDASVALEIVFPFATADLRHLARLFRQGGASVPEIWHWETTNAVLKAERRRAIPSTAVDLTLKALAAFVDTTEMMGAELSIPPLVDVARNARLSLFDAAYLDLADRTGLPLATLDSGLAAAARAAGIPLLALTP